MPVLGSIIFFGFLPFVAFSIIACTLWDYVDRNYLKFVWFLQEHPKAREWYNIFNRFVRHPHDNFLVPLTFWLGVVLPGILVLFGIINNNIGCTTFDTCTNNNNDSKLYYFLLLVVSYDVLRIGPMYINFAYAYAGAHKEAHHLGNIFTFSKHFYPMNYWIGFFHGLAPGTFTTTHLQSHHRYNNDIFDVHSTVGYPRDSFYPISILDEICRVFFFYSSNISGLWSLYYESQDETRNIKQRIKSKEYFNYLILESISYIVFIIIWAYLFGWPFTFATIIYPFWEANILLSLISYCWHLFYEKNEANEFIESTTILNGKNFIFNEEYHVVHHQFPGLHWSKYPAMYKKYLPKYDIIFKDNNIFVFGFTCILGNYEKLREMVVKPVLNDKGEDITIDILKRRLRTTLW